MGKLASHVSQLPVLHSYWDPGVLWGVGITLVVVIEHGARETAHRAE